MIIIKSVPNAAKMSPTDKAILNFLFLVPVNLDTNIMSLVNDFNFDINSILFSILKYWI